MAAPATPALRYVLYGDKWHPEPTLDIDEEFDMANMSYRVHYSLYIRGETFHWLVLSLDKPTPEHYKVWDKNCAHAMKMTLQEHFGSSRA